MSPDLDDLRNEILRKIGRNVVLFQQLELMLKFLVAHGKLSGYTRDLEDIKEQQKAKVMRQTLGQVANQFLENTHGEYHEIDEELPDLKEKGGHVSFSFRIQSDEEYYLKCKENLAKIIQERNDLIHHFLMNFNLNEIESLIDAEKYLNSQRESLLPEHDMVKQYLDALEAGRDEIATYIASGEFIKQWRMNELRQEYVVKLLAGIIDEAKRADGWTLVAHAGQLLQKNAPGQLKDIKNKYKCRTLKDLILKTEIFDIEDESTPKGGRRAIYRLKDGWTLEISVQGEAPQPTPQTPTFTGEL